MQSKAWLRVLLSGDDICSAIRRYSLTEEAEGAISPLLRMRCDNISSEAARVFEFVESTPYSTQNWSTLLLGTVLSIIAKMLDSLSLNLLSPSYNKGKPFNPISSSNNTTRHSPFELAQA
jgi:hypothetical protein